MFITFLTFFCDRELWLAIVRCYLVCYWMVYLCCPSLGIWAVSYLLPPFHLPHHPLWYIAMSCDWLHPLSWLSPLQGWPFMVATVIGYGVISHVGFSSLYCCSLFRDAQCAPMVVTVIGYCNVSCDWLFLSVASRSSWMRSAHPWW